MPYFNSKEHCIANFEHAPMSPDEARRLAQSFTTFMIGDLKSWPSHEDRKNKRLSTGLPFQIWHISGPQPGEISLGVVVGEVNQLIEQSENGEGVLTRLHSGCLYSHRLDIANVNSSRRTDIRVETDRAPESHTCDCAEQSAAAQHRIEEEGGVYVSIPRHEGRGAGLDFKRIAVKIEEEYGLTTAEAYGFLGQKFDQRNYEPELNFLKIMGFHAIRLLTNNPAKINAAEEAGLTVVREEIIQPNMAWNDYLAVKRDIAGHIFPSNQELDRLARQADMQ